MSQALFALERRFELRALYVFAAALVGVLVVAIVREDWWLVGICVVAFLLDGAIGQGLRKNPSKSFSELAAGSAGESEIPQRELEPVEFRAAAKSVMKFIALVVLTVAAIAIHLSQPWWVIGCAALAAWLLSIFLTVLAFYRRQQPQ